MLSYEKTIPFSSPKRVTVVGFDLEWTKNYKIKNGNKPFCFSFVFFPGDVALSTVEKQLHFGFYLRYAEREEDMEDLIREANRILGDFLDYSGAMTIVGHQLSSDISVILNCPSGKQKSNFIRLKTLWQERKQVPSKKRNLEVFDSRYDLEVLLKKKSRRLVDVCEECRLEVVQPEISSSMTKMQSNFYVSGEKKIMEKLSILNIRHSLSAAILFLIHRDKRKASMAINVNRILRRNLADQFDYVSGKEFEKLL